MANAYSLLNNYNEPVYVPNFNLIGQVLSSKQGSLDASREGLEDFYNDQIDNLNLIRDEDKAYANSRIAQVDEILSKYSSQELTNNGLKKALQRDISKIVDDRIERDIYSTTVYQQEQQQWNKLRSENPDKYSKKNHAYARQNADKWITGEVQNYNGGGGVIEHVDVNSTIIKELPDLLKSVGVSQRIEITPRGKEALFYDEETHEVLEEYEVKKMMKMLIGDKENQQLQINAWAMKQSSDPEKLQEDYTNFFTKQKDQLEESIKLQEEFIKTNGLKEDSKAQKSLNNMYEQKAEMIPTTDMDQAAYQMYMNSFENKVASAFAYDKTISTAVKEYGIKKGEYIMSIEKHDLDMLQKKANLQKSYNEIQGSQPYINPTTGLPSIINSDNIADITTDTGENGHSGEAKLSENLNQEFTNALDGIKTSDLIPEELAHLRTKSKSNFTKKDYDDLYQAIQKAENGKSVSPEDALKLSNYKIASEKTAQFREVAKTKYNSILTRYKEGLVNGYSQRSGGASSILDKETFGFRVEEGEIIKDETTETLQELVTLKKNGTITEDQEETLDLYVLHKLGVTKGINREDVVREFNTRIEKYKGSDEYLKKGTGTSYFSGIGLSRKGVGGFNSRFTEEKDNEDLTTNTGVEILWNSANQLFDAKLEEFNNLSQNKEIVLTDSQLASIYGKSEKQAKEDFANKMMASLGNSTVEPTELKKQILASTFSYRELADGKKGVYLKGSIVVGTGDKAVKVGMENEYLTGVIPDGAVNVLREEYTPYDVNSTNPPKEIGFGIEKRTEQDIAVNIKDIPMLTGITEENTLFNIDYTKEYQGKLKERVDEGVLPQEKADEFTNLIKSFKKGELTFKFKIDDSGLYQPYIKNSQGKETKLTGSSPKVTITRKDLTGIYSHKEAYMEAYLVNHINALTGIN